MKRTAFSQPTTFTLKSFSGMFKTLITAVLVSATTLLASAQDDKPIKPRITDVTVFLQGAQITHATDISLKSGENRIRITDLPLYMDPNSIQVEGNASYTIISVRHQVNYLADARSNPEIKAVMDSLDDAVSRREELQALREVYNDEINLYHSNAAFKGSDDQLLPEDLGEMAAFYRNKLKEIRYKQLEINQSEKKLNEQINRLQTQLNNLNARKGTNPSEILITLQANKDGRVPLRVSYVAQNCGWFPVYDLRAEDLNSNIEFAYRAKVYQSTGTNWEDVNLTISTGNPNTGGQVPTLYPWYINLYQPQPITLYSRGEANSQAPAAYKDKEYSMEESKVSSWSGNATVSQNVVNAEFKITSPYDIPSDNQQYDVIMQKQSLPASYAYITVPKLDSDAFLRARITDWAQYALLPGESNIYFKGTYVGKGYIDPAMSTDTLDLSLGRDNSIVVKREQVKDFCKTSLLGGKQETTRAYDITLVNNKKQSIDIIVEDQLPISQNGDVEVETEEISGGTYDAQTGKVTWTLKLNAGENVKKQLRFKVSYPKKKYISGL